MDQGMEGWLYKKSGGIMKKKWSKRWFVAELFKWSYFPDEKKSKLLGVASLQTVTDYDASSAKDTDKQFFFSITVPDKVYNLYATSDEERQKWIKYISQYASPDKSKGNSKKSQDISSSSTSKTTSTSTPTSTSTTAQTPSINVNQASIELTQQNFTAIPTTIFSSEVVENLNLSENCIAIIPPTISSLKSSLKILNLSYNKITIFPEELSMLHNLEELNLHSNLLTALPQSVGSLVKLQLLWISQNKITKLPSSLGNLTSLQKFSIAFNMDDNSSENDEDNENDENENENEEEGLLLPAELSSCKSMIWLDISGNKLQSFPDLISGFPNLQVLEATNNKFRKIPSELGNLQNLQQLRLANNFIKEIPASLGDLQNLQELELSFNKLNNLPASFGKSKAFIEVHNNPFKEMPAEVISKGSNAIKKYLRETQQQ